MSNPAKELLELIDLWDSRSGVIFNRRKPEDRNDPIGHWEETLQAEKLILEIWDFYETTMGGIKDVEPTFVSLIRWIHQPTSDWSHNSPSALSPDIRSWLVITSRLIDAEGIPNRGTIIFDSEIESLQRSLEEIISATDIFPKEVSYFGNALRELAESTLACTSANPIDAVQFRKQLFGLIGFIAIMLSRRNIFDQVDQCFTKSGGFRETANRFFTKAGHWFFDVSTATTTAIAANTITDTIRLISK